MGALSQPVNGFFTASASLRGRLVVFFTGAFRNPYRWFKMNTGLSGTFIPDRERPYPASPVVWVLLAFVLLATTAFLT